VERNEEGEEEEGLRRATQIEGTVKTWTPKKMRECSGSRSVRR